MEISSDLEALRDFICDNSDLERLEDIVDDFNVFSALDIVKSEVRHSAFLAWLLNPSASHGLGDYFLSSFLKDIASKNSIDGEGNPSVFDIDSWRFEDAEILREWRNIDILIKSEVHKLTCVVENKIQSQEHGDQLQRYKETIKSEYPDHHLLLVFLTVDGDIPSDNEYVGYTYSDLVKLIERLISAKKDKVGTEVISFISHYLEMLRRYIVEDSEIHQICKQIYQEHKRALDLIFEYRPDKLAEISDCLVELISQDPQLIVDSSGKAWVRFTSSELDFIPKEGQGWVDSNRILLFVFNVNEKVGVNVAVLIGPGSQEIRKELYSIMNANQGLFNRAKYKLTPQWFTAYTRSIVSAKEVQEIDMAELQPLLAERLNTFKDDDLLRIVEELKRFGKVLA